MLFYIFVPAVPSVRTNSGSGLLTVECQPHPCTWCPAPPLEVDSLSVPFPTIQPFIHCFSLWVWRDSPCLPGLWYMLEGLSISNLPRLPVFIFSAGPQCFSTVPTPLHTHTILSCTQMYISVPSSNEVPPPSAPHTAFFFLPIGIDTFSLGFLRFFNLLESCGLYPGYSVHFWLISTY